MTADWFYTALRHDRAVVLGSLALVVALAWLWLWLGAGIDMEEMDMGGGQMMLMLPEWSVSYGLVVFAMWAVMMVAMMLPSAAPVTLLVANIARNRAASGGGAGAGTVFFVIGYLAVWTAFAAFATLLQWGLDEAGLMSDTMALANRIAAGVVLIVAGIYQWTPLKEACLRHCRSPLQFLLFHWREGRLGALTSGIGHGAYCLGCCWMLMALLFVGGIMNLAWIAAIALLVLIEKTVPRGAWLGRAIGALLIVGGAATLAMAA
jgi:predicted metal-binding membrane protein